MSDATGRIVDRLTQLDLHVKQAGRDRWVSRCPAHEDKVASLSIRRGRGQALLFCFAGCQTQDIVRALNLRMEDLFDDPKGVEYRYQHEGRVVRVVSRNALKRFVQQVFDKEHVTLYEPDGVDVASAVRDGVTVWLPEGEKDADTLASVGAVAVSSPMGAGNWGKADYSPLYGAKECVIVADRDDAGERRAGGLSEMLRKHVGHVRIVQAKFGKDATDHLTAGGTLDDFVPFEFQTPDDPEFRERVEEEAARIRVKDEARKLAKELAAAEASELLHAKTLREILATEVAYDWLVPGLLERTDRFMLTGFEGFGKSWLLRQIAICVAAGVSPFVPAQRVDPGRVLVIDAENSEKQWQRGTKYMTDVAASHGVDPQDRVIVSAGRRIDLSVASNVNEVHKLIDLHKPDLLYLGPVYKMVGGAINNDDDAAPLIAAMDSFRERGVALLVEAHAGHSMTMGERDLRPRGSAALLGWPEFGFGFAPVDGDPSMGRLVPWRGAREERSGWPEHLRRGVDGELPWVATF